MNKKLVSLIGIGLFVLMAARTSSALTLNNLTLDNNIAQFVINNTTGVIEQARYYNNGVLSGNLLDSSPTNYGFTFGVYYDGASQTAWLHNVITSGPHPSGNAYRYEGIQSVSPGVSLSIQWDVMLPADKNYLDMRANLTATGGNVTGVKPYFYMELPEGSVLSRSSETSGSSGWNIINDTTNSWVGGKPWPASNYVFAGNWIGTVVREDRNQAGNAVSIWNTANSGNQYAGFPTTYSGPNPAWGMKIDNYNNSPSLVYNISSGSSQGFEARLEVNPEPGTMGLMLTGLLGLAGLARKRIFRA